MSLGESKVCSVAGAVVLAVVVLGGCTSSLVSYHISSSLCSELGLQLSAAVGKEMVATIPN